VHFILCRVLVDRATGIGAAIAQNLAAKGCSLLLVYASDSSKELIEALCKTLSEQHSVRCIAVQADLAQPSRSVAHIISTAQNNFSHPKTRRFQIDILINNAGVAGNKMLNDKENGPIEEAQFHQMYNVNVLAPLLLTQACEPHLPTDRSGRIVNISSVSSAIGYPGQSIYGGTKAALEAMTRTWSRELAERCTVNCVNPGPVWGDMYESAGEKFWKGNQPFVDVAPLMAYRGEGEVRIKAGEGHGDRFEKTVKEGMGGRRPGFPSEIAGVVGMLCSDESSWTTGSVISSNGGMVMSH
jgi:NAD(P)-dependent dehydrogenase (short-subunit alcohol dehydrogenase family)